MHSPIVQKKLDRLQEITKLTEPENVGRLKEGDAAVRLMTEVRRLQMELLHYKSTTDVLVSSPRLKPEIMQMFDLIKKRISEATGEPFFEQGTREKYRKYTT